MDAPDPPLAELAARFPGWDFWRGTDRLWHARRAGDPAQPVLTGESTDDLRDQVRAAGRG